MARSIPFYNRKPWNLLIGIGLLLAPVVLVAGLTSWWLLFLPVGLVTGASIWKSARRALSLAKFGYHSDQIRDGLLRYEELVDKKRRALHLRLENSEPGHWELFVPDENSWSSSVPDWAIGRRSEIANRIAQTWRWRDVHIS
jgi:hypothetical protein